VEIGLASIVQINVTMIAGIMILFSIAKIINDFKGFMSFPKAIFAMMAPFCVSSIFSILASIISVENGKDTMHVTSLIVMIVGFLYILLFLGWRTKKEFWN
jgi:hypothetical protein